MCISLSADTVVRQSLDNMNMIIMQSLVERLRPLVCLNGWDYCVLWKLSEDQRFIEWSGCCCAGADQSNQNAREELFPVSSVVLCRDSQLPHSRTNSCVLLSQLPSSVPLDSGTHGQSLMTNQVNWLNYSNSTVSEFMDEAIGTRVFFPVFGGLVELFVNKQVAEDQNVIDFVTSQCNLLMEQDVLMNSNNMDKSFSVDANSMSNIQSNPFSGSEKDGRGHPTNQHLLWSHDSLLLDNQMNPLMKSNGMDELHDMEGFEKYMMSNTRNSLERKEQQGDDRDSVKQELGKSDSVSNCTDQLEDEDDDVKCRRRNGKGPQSKNLLAERKRRKKLNDRLYALRTLVPKISKLDRASILGDAIDFVKELEKQVKELQDELEDNSDDGARSNNCINGHLGNKLEHDKAPSSFHLGISGNGNISKQNQELENSSDRIQQMEPQVEVALIEGNEFFVKVFCEHKPGGFSRLMDAFESLGMEVTNANVTSHKGLVSHVFKVEKKDSEMVQAEDVRDSLLEITRNPQRCWTEIAKGSDNDIGMDYHHHHHVANQPLSPYQQHQLQNFQS